MFTRASAFGAKAILREAIFRDGEFHTQLLMSILDREYEAIRRSNPTPRASAAIQTPFFCGSQTYL